jgi:hypothetical protein
MTFDEILGQAIEMLQRRGRVSYGALKRQFGLDDEYLADLKSELIEVLAVAVDQDGKMLVWNGAGRPAAPSMHTSPASPPPASYTPSHLAERIRAEQAAMEARGAAQVKGATGPLKIYEVLGVGPLRTRLQVAARRGLARFILIAVTSSMTTDAGS